MEIEATGNQRSSLLLPQQDDLQQSENLLQYLLFSVEDRFYGIDILNIHEILKPVTLTRLPNVRPDVLGVINLRGNIIPVIDLRKKFFNEYTELGDSCRIIVGNSNNKNIGLLVASISEVARIKPEQLEASNMEDVSGQHIKGVGRSGDKVFLIINLAVLYNQIGDATDSEDV